MNDPDKLRVLLPRWIEHYGEHAGEFRRWARQVPPVQEQLQAAAQLLEQANGRLQEALAKRHMIRILQAIKALSDRLLFRRGQEEVHTMGAPRSSKRDLAGEHSFTDIGQLLLCAVFLITWFTDSIIFRYSVFLTVYVPAYIRLPVGIAFLIASALLALSAHKALFGEPDRKPSVITTGAFSLVRHPLYFGSWLFSVGLVIITFSASSAVVSLVILVFYCLVARYEERLLLRKFSDEYRKYQACVPMFLPIKFGRKQPRRGMGSGPRSAEVPGRIR